MGHDEDDFVIAPDHDARRWWIVAAIVVVLLAIAAGAWALALRSGSREEPRRTPPRIEPAAETTETALPQTSATVSPTGSVAPTEPTGAGTTSRVATNTGGSPATPRRAPYMAFRLNGTVYLAREDGVRAIPLVETEGVFALSPDARSLAFVDPSSNRLAVIDLSKQTTTTVGPARQVTPVWSPDSSWVLGVRDASTGQGTEVFRALRSTGSIAVLGPGVSASVSPDGSVVALVPMPTGTGTDELILLKNGRPWKKIRAPGPVLDAALGQSAAYAATTRVSQSGAAEGVWSLGFDGRSRLMSTPDEANEPGDFGTLELAGNAAVSGLRPRGR